MNRRALLLSFLTICVAGCASFEQPPTVVQVIAADPNLSTLNSLIKEAGLSDSLSGSGPFTVFAPTNEAFKAVPAKTMGQLAADKDMLKSVLAFHVLPEKVLAADVKPGNAKTINGAALPLSRAGAYVTADEALVIGPDKQAGNGIVQVIDRVLMPPKR